MKQYVIRRVLALFPLALGVSLLVFLAMNFIPGDPVRIMLGIEATPELAAQLRQVHGLDRPLPIQYLSWLGRLLQGDMGNSLVTGVSVFQELWTRTAVTVQLSILAVIVGVLVAVPLGIVSALKQDSWLDLLVRLLALAGISLPGFAMGILLILFASRVLNWYPPIGFVNIWQDPVTALGILVLPVLSLSLGLMAAISRMTRSSMLEILQQDYMRTARSKGLAQRTIVYRHGLRNALIPIVTLVGLQTGYLLGGAVVIEEVFSLPGIGRLLLTAIGNRDYPVVMGTVLFIALLFSLVNTIIDLLYAVIEPRIRYQ